MPTQIRFTKAESLSQNGDVGCGHLMVPSVPLRTTWSPSLTPCQTEKLNNQGQPVDPAPLLLWLFLLLSGAVDVGGVVVFVCGGCCVFCVLPDLCIIYCFRACVGLNLFVNMCFELVVRL